MPNFKYNLPNPFQLPKKGEPLFIDAQPQNQSLWLNEDMTPMNTQVANSTPSFIAPKPVEKKSTTPSMYVTPFGFMPRKMADPLIAKGIATTTPVREKPSLLQKFGEYVLPKPKVRPVDIIREFPGAIAQTGKEIGQSIVRSFFNVGQAIYDKSFKTKFKPQGKMQEALIGKEPTNLERGGRELANIVGGGEKISPNIAIGLGILSAGLDIIPIGGGEKQGLKQIFSNIAKSKNEVNILRNLKKIFKGSDEILKPLAKEFVNISDVKIVEKNIKALQVGVKNAKIITPKSPLIQEGGKRKTILTQADLDELQYGVQKKTSPVAEKVIPEMPSNLSIKIAETSDVQGNKIGQVIFKEIPKEISQPAKNKIFQSMPDYNGWEKVYKPYGEQGKGFYYTKKLF